MFERIIWIVIWIIGIVVMLGQVFLLGLLIFLAFLAIKYLLGVV